MYFILIIETQAPLMLTAAPPAFIPPYGQPQAYGYTPQPQFNSYNPY